MTPPKITCYARILSNLTGKYLTDWKMYDDLVLYYGKCNKNGGESEYIIELDIWNNEPSFAAGEFKYIDANAINCQLTVEPNGNLDLFKLGYPFLYARCYTSYKREPWESITPYDPLTNIYGNVNSNLKGVIQGCSDHSIIQTKLILKENDLNHSIRYPFILKFAYDYEIKDYKFETV